MERKQRKSSTTEQNSKGGGKIINIFLLAAHTFQAISKNLIATHFLVYLGLNIIFFYHMVILFIIFIIWL